MSAGCFIRQWLNIAKIVLMMYETSLRRYIKVELILRICYDEKMWIKRVCYVLQNCDDNGWIGLMFITENNDGEVEKYGKEG